MATYSYELNASPIHTHKLHGVSRGQMIVCFLAASSQSAVLDKKAGRVQNETDFI